MMKGLRLMDRRIMISSATVSFIMGKSCFVSETFYSKALMNCMYDSKIFSLDRLMIQIFRISTISKCLRALGKIIPKENEHQ